MLELLFKIMQHQIHVPTDDILPLAPITATRLSHVGLYMYLLILCSKFAYYVYAFWHFICIMLTIYIHI